MKLKYKFFIAFIIISLLILLMVVGVTQLTIKKNFIQFVNNTVLEEQTKMVALLKKSYQQKNGWDEFRDNHAAWNTLFFQSNPDNSDVNVNLPAQPEHHKKPKDRRPHPEALSYPLPPKPMGPPPLHLRLCLFDADKQYVAGNYMPHDQFDYIPIIISNQTIGWLGLKNHPDMISPLGLEFFKNQTNSFYTIGLGIFILALIISYIMSKLLLAPIQELVTGTKAIRNLDFNTKIKVNTTDELGRLAEDFNLMVQTLKQYETLRKNWISDISHELRTPVAVIQSKIESLQDGIRVMTPLMLESLHNDVLGLGKLVNDLHLISLSDSKSLLANPKTIDLLDVINKCLDTFQIRFEKQEITIQTDWEKADRIESRGDAILLNRVFSNLVENTLRYTDSPGTFKISHRINEKQITLCVEDSSPGVPDHAISYIFDRLYRVEQSRNRSSGGSGLGLSIAKQIITQHNGNIEACSSVLGGIKIKIVLPLYKKQG